MNLTPNGARMLAFLGTLMSIVIGCSVLYAKLAVNAERQMENSQKLDDIKTSISSLSKEVQDKNLDQDKKIEDHLKNLVRIDAYLGIESP